MADLPPSKGAGGILFPLQERQKTFPQVYKQKSSLERNFFVTFNQSVKIYK